MIPLAPGGGPIVAASYLADFLNLVSSKTENDAAEAKIGYLCAGASLAIPLTSPFSAIPHADDARGTRSFKNFSSRDRDRYVFS